MKKYISLLLALLLCFSLISCGNAEHGDVTGSLGGLSIRGDFSHRDDVEDFQELGPANVITGQPTDSKQLSAALPEESTFAVHYIDVGQADAALVLCDGEAMLIDGGNAEDSNLIYTYLKNLSIDHLEYPEGREYTEDTISFSGGNTFHIKNDLQNLSRTGRPPR